MVMQVSGTNIVCDFFLLMLLIYRCYSNVSAIIYWLEMDNYFYWRSLQWNNRHFVLNLAGTISTIRVLPTGQFLPCSNLGFLHQINKRGGDGFQNKIFYTRIGYKILGGENEEKKDIHVGDDGGTVEWLSRGGLCRPSTSACASSSTGSSTCPSSSAGSSAGPSAGPSTGSSTCTS